MIRRVIKQMPFWGFIGLKVFLFLALWITYIRDVFSCDTSTLILLPSFSLVVWLGYLILSVLYGLYLRKKHLFWATVFVSLEWIVYIVDGLESLGVISVKGSL
ncbi:MAG: hypothetical protein IJO11_03935 [Alphaproteobacteria bacterium]|nr:hypothetical protein [Alphaproteobacteria bacterium]MBQ8557953.1 hypothetical protein [Alphaproteobacteria bacterium]